MRSNQKTTAIQYKKQILEKVSAAIDLQELIYRKINLGARFNVRNNGNVSLHLAIPYSEEDPDLAQERIHTLSKVLKTHFDKGLTQGRKLVYRGVKDGVRITVNTDQCFYGGKAKAIVRQPRTRFVCPIGAKK